MTVLDDIVAGVREDLVERQARTSLADLQAVTDDLASRALALPMANDLSEEERQRVVEVVLDAARGR